MIANVPKGYSAKKMVELMVPAVDAYKRKLILKQKQSKAKEHFDHNKFFLIRIGNRKMKKIEHTLR